MNKNNTLSFYYLILLLTDSYDNGTLIKKKSTTYIYIFYLRQKLYSKHISNIYMREEADRTHNPYGECTTVGVAFN